MNVDAEKSFRKKLRAMHKDFWRSPLGKFIAQRNNARQRGIEWCLSLEEWWEIWEISGKFDVRGRGVDQYAMCRLHDEGPYAVGNVEIRTVASNAREYHEVTRYAREVSDQGFDGAVLHLVEHEAHRDDREIQISSGGFWQGFHDEVTHRYCNPEKILVAFESTGEVPLK